MARVLGIGGVFFRCVDRDALAAWYAEHLGMEVNELGGVELDSSELPPAAYAVWGPFRADSAVETMNAILREDPREDEASGAQIPPHLDRIFDALDDGGIGRGKPGRRPELGRGGAMECNRAVLKLRTFGG